MDFWGHQDVARTQLLKLWVLYAVMLFGVGVLSAYAFVTMVCLPFILVELLISIIMPVVGTGPLDLLFESLGNTPGIILFAVFSVIAILLVTIGRLVFYVFNGGEAVAKSLGGEHLARPANPHEQQLLNLMDEMCVATMRPGIKVFLLRKDAGINAFAAGFRDSRAVVGVTHGALTKLSRDELQGVLAHEFSHIACGDMRMNMVLNSMIFGMNIFNVIGLILEGFGKFFFAIFRGIESLGALLLLPVCAVFYIAAYLFYLVGRVGRFAGMVLQSAMSRQREFMADARAVEFTRNPYGIHNALVKIANNAIDSEFLVHTANYSHMFFCSSIKNAFAGLLDSHPCIEERVGRIQDIMAQTNRANSPG